MYSIMLNNMFLNKSEHVFVCVCVRENGEENTSYFFQTQSVYMHTHKVHIHAHINVNPYTFYIINTVAHTHI